MEIKIKKQIKDITIQAIKKIQEEDYIKVVRKCQNTLEYYEKFNAINTNVKNHQANKEQIKKKIDEIQKAENIIKLNQAIAELEDIRKKILEIKNEKTTKDAFKDFYNQYQETLKELRKLLGREIEIIVVTNKGEIIKKADIEYKMKLGSGVKGLIPAIKVKGLKNKNIDKIKIEEIDASLVKAYNAVREDAKKFKKKGGSFYTYYTNNQGRQWFYIQSLGSLNEAYACFHFHNLLKVTKSKLITNEKYGIIAVGNAKGTLQEDIMLIENGTIKGFGVKSLNASGMGFEEEIKNFEKISKASDLKSFKKILTETYGIIEEGFKINRKLTKQEDVDTINFLNQELDKILSDLLKNKS